MKRNLFTQSLLVSLFLACAASVQAETKLASIFGPNMVLQRDMKIPIWGTAKAGTNITVEFNGKKATTKADANGKWKVYLPPMKSDGKSHVLSVISQEPGSDAAGASDYDGIMLGEVWLGSGQSNMEWPMTRTQDPQKNIAAAKYPNIRLFHVKRAKQNMPVAECEGKWEACTPDSVKNFSGVLYYFGKNLHEELDCPIGLIESAWGGTRIEPWTVSNGKNAVLYNGMIAPVQPYAIRGAIWYQGESNVRDRGMKYYGKMKDLISGWRKKWGYQLPFYFVQIAPWANYPDEMLPELWEAQVASLKIPKTGMAVVTDIVDNIKDIHPQNKHDVGRRLALWALAKDYGKKELIYSSPLYKSMKVEGNKIRINFSHTGKGLKSSNGKPLTEFQIAGEDGKYVDAKAKADGNSVIVWAEGVDNPAHVRFGWHKTAQPNLVNSAGLPASPFRTKNWQGWTGSE